MTILVHLRNHIRKFSFSILETKSISTSAIKLNDKITNNSSKETKCCSKQKTPVVEIGQPTAWTHPHLFDPSKKDQVTPGLTKQEFEHRRDNYVKNLKTFQMHYFSSKLKEITTQNPSFIAFIPSAMTSFLAPDVPHMFKQNSDFLYLTGFNEPNSVLVFSNVDNDTTYKAALFVKVVYFFSFLS
jgi:Xaa-Pro aminopeptidase